MQASALLDKWMFAMTFFVKLVSHDGRTRVAKSEICEALDKAQVWPLLIEFLLG
jgi:hypothetical protein